MGKLNPVMVVVARESRGLSQSAVAEMVGIEQGTWSKIEHGRIQPSAEVAERIAGQLGYTVELLTSELNFKQLPLSFFRKQQRVSQRTAKMIRARINLLSLHAKTMLQEADLPPLRLIRAAVGNGVQGAAQAARDLRVHWHVPPGPISNLTGLIESNGILVAVTDLGDERVDAISIYDVRDDELPPVILVSSSLSADRYRFTLAHELGHVVMHHHQLIPDDTVDVEAQAHAFAAEFLMPAKDIRGHFSRVTLPALANLKTHWGTSMQALLYRANELGKVSHRTQRYLWMQMGKAGYRKQEPVSIPSETPTLLQELVSVYETQTRKTRAQVSRAFGFLNFEEFEQLYGSAARGDGRHLRLVAM